MACLVTVATITAKNLYPVNFPIKIGRMNVTAMEKLCQQENIAVIVDASHPFATEVSQKAIAIAKQEQIPYLRYERLVVQSSVNSDRSSVIELSSFDELLTGNYLCGKRVLLTIGCQSLHLFKSWHQNSTLFARILPKPASLAMTIAAGFTTDKIIAIRPPLNKNLEQALWQQWRISLVVTKASGKAGGEDIKREVARELGIPLIALARPEMVYPQQTSCLEKTVSFCRQQLLKGI